MSDSVLQSRQPIRINDRLILKIAIPFLSIFFLHLGCSCSLNVLLNSRVYYYNLLFNLALTTGLIFWVRKGVFWLNNNYQWKVNTAVRLLLQVSVNLILPITIVVLCCYFFGVLVGVPFRNVFRWHIELPVVALVLLIINAFYEVVFVLANNAGYEIKQKGAREPKMIMLKKGSELRRVPFRSIAYFNISNQNVYAVAFDGTKFLTDKSLDDLQSEAPNHFFRLNRQYMANFKAIDGFQKASHQKLSVRLYAKEEIATTISKNKAPRFKSWLQGLDSQ